MKRFLLSSTFLTTLIIASAFAMTVQAAPQEFMEDGKLLCTKATAQEMSAIEELCECDAVTSSMLAYLRRQTNFGEILEVTSESCPAFTAVLTNVPVAAIPQGFGISDSGDDGAGFESGTGPGPGPDPYPDPDPSPDPDPNPDPDPDPDPDPGGHDGDHDKGHGNDEDGHDADNPGKSEGPGPKDDRGLAKGHDKGGDDDGNRGHGNDEDGYDAQNPGKSKLLAKES